MAPAAGFLTPVVLKRGTDVLETQRVRAPFSFRFTVEPGDYVVVGLNDIPARVHATPGSTTTLQLNGDCE